MDDSVDEDETKTKGNCCKINKEYIPLKLLYLFFIGGQSCAMTYRSVYMKHLGMSTRQTGIVWALERVISAVIPPLVGAITDKSRRPKIVLIALFMLGAITLSSMYFVPPEDYVCVTNSSSNVTILNNETHCDEIVATDIDEYGLTFWTLVFLVFASSFSLVGIYPVLESTVLGVLGPENRRYFGLQRLWASVGYGSAALLVGYLKDKSAKSISTLGGNNRAFLSMFVGVLICYCCAAAVSAKLPVKAAKSREQVRLKDIQVFLKNSKACAFLCLLFFFGVDCAILEIYLFWLAEIKFNSPSFILGTSTFIGCALDIPFCLFAGFLTKKLGHATLLCFGLGTMAIRTFLGAMVVNPWQLVASESLRGITWGLMFVVICSYTSKLSPKGLEASSMGIMQSFLFGIAYSVGALVGGVIFSSMGGDFLFILCGSATFIATILFGVFSFFTRAGDITQMQNEFTSPPKATKNSSFSNDIDCKNQNGALLQSMSEGAM